MSKALSKRSHDVFISYAHVNASLAREIGDWMEAAGLIVWFDEASMGASQQIHKALEQGIADSRAILILATPEAADKGWVDYEVGIGLDERAIDQNFKVIVVAFGGTSLTERGRGFSKIVAETMALDADLALALIRALHPPKPPIVPDVQRDVYVSLSWRPGDDTLNRPVLAEARTQGLRLVGDSPDRRHYGSDRIKDIMSTCGAFIGILPWRGVEEAWAIDDERGKSEYRYFLREADIAERLGIPRLIIAPEGIRRLDGDDSFWLRVAPDETKLTPEIGRGLEILYHDWHKPENEDLIFYATDLDEDPMVTNQVVRSLLESITGMRVVTGPDLYGSHTQDRILATIRQAQLVIDDLTGASDADFNINVAIEAGVAYSHGREVRLIARGRDRSAPFMLRNTGQFTGYASPVDQLALLRRIGSQFRRRIYDG